MADEADPVDLLVDVPAEDEVSPDVDVEAKPEGEGEGKPAAKAQAKPDAKPAVVPDDKPQPRRDNSVPLATFLQEKTKFSKAIEDRDTAINELKERLAKLENPAKPTPAYDTDPKGFIEHATREATKPVLEKLAEATKGIDDVKKSALTSAEREQQAQFFNDLSMAEAEFVAAHDDYPAALLHVRQIAYQQIVEFHPDATHEQILDVIGKQELAMAAQAMKQGKNPHDVVYRFAAMNGYKKAAAPAVKGAAKPNGKAPVAAPELEDGKLSPDTSLGVSGGGGGGDADAEAQFDPEKDDPFDNALKEMFGRKRA